MLRPVDDIYCMGKFKKKNTDLNSYRSDYRVNKNCEKLESKRGDILRVFLMRHYLHRSCCQQPGGGRGDTDSAALPLSPSGNQTGSAGRNMRPLLEDRQGNTG